MKPGDRVTVEGPPAKDGSFSADARKVESPDGRMVFAGSSGRQMTDKYCARRCRFCRAGDFLEKLTRIPDCRRGFRAAVSLSRRRRTTPLLPQSGVAEDTQAAFLPYGCK